MNASINEVYKTLIEAGILVLIVILIFLQDWRAMLVPATTVPVTIIGAFAAMAALGFTINLSTLFGLVLAIGIVVDDAIVIVENVAHHIERGMSPHEATIKAMDELFGPVIGITLVLMAVFLPAAFLPGITGQIFGQFALVIAATALISAINAATLKPTQCAMWLRPAVPPEKRNFFFRGFNKSTTASRRLRLADRRHGARSRPDGPRWRCVLAGLGGWGVARLPTAFIPNEDQGYLLIGVQLPDGASLERTDAALAGQRASPRRRRASTRSWRSAASRCSTATRTLANAGVIYVIFKDWGVRRKARARTCARSSCTSASALTVAAGRPGLRRSCRRPIQGIGNAGGFQMQVEQQRRQLRLRQAAGRHRRT